MRIQRRRADARCYQQAIGKRRCRTSCRTWSSLPSQPVPLRRQGRCRPPPPPAPSICSTCSTAPQRSDLRRMLVSACTTDLTSRVPALWPPWCMGAVFSSPRGPGGTWEHGSPGNLLCITPGTAAVLEWATHGGLCHAVQPLAWSEGRVRAGGAGHRLTSRHLHQLREAPGRLPVSSTEPSLCFACPLACLTHPFETCRYVASHCAAGCSCLLACALLASAQCFMCVMFDVCKCQV